MVRCFIWLNININRQNDKNTTGEGNGVLEGDGGKGRREGFFGEN
jgi:hypothetical protein